MFLGNDFQSINFEYFITIRPDTFTDKSKGQVDFLVALDQKDAIKYLQTQSDFYIITRDIRTEDDYLVDVYCELITTSIPQNILTINTLNGKNWVPTTSAYNSIMVSSQKDASLTDPQTSAYKGVRADASAQRLLFTLRIPYTDATSGSTSSNTALTNSLGVQIVTSPLVTI